jgi:hypothetical protein
LGDTMPIANLASRLRNRFVVSAAILALVAAQTGLAQAAAAGSGEKPFGPDSRDLVTHTPIKHMIIIIGENRTFDNVFATYEPKSGQTVWNLLSEGIVKPDGSPGMNYLKARQLSATDTSKFELAPPGVPYATLPAFHAGGGADKFGTPFGCAVLGIALTPPATNCNTPANVAAVMPFENGLALTPANAGGPIYYQYLLTGGTGQTKSGSTTSSLVPDARVYYDGEDASALPPGPFQISQMTHAPFMPYDAYTVSPVHRLFQMWQQLDCAAEKATTANPSGCRSDLWPWVESTVAAGSNGAAEPAGWIGEGSTSMFFYNVQTGDAPYLKSLADTYTMSDNYHQAVLGGTGANHIMMGSGDAIWFSNGAGVPEVPPNNPVDPAAPGTPLPGHSSALSEVENPDPMPMTNNFWKQDGYGGGPFIYGGRLRPMRTTAAVLTSTAGTRPNPGSGLSPAILPRLSRASSPIASPATIISSTTITPAISATARTPSQTRIPITPRSRFRRRTCPTSVSSCQRIISRGPISATSSISTWPTPIKSTSLRRGPARIITATSATGRNTILRS